MPPPVGPFLPNTTHFDTKQPTHIYTVPQKRGAAFPRPQMKLGGQQILVPQMQHVFHSLQSPVDRGVGHM